MEHVVLTGIGGYIGRHVAAELLDAGYSVTGTVRSLARADGIRQAIATRANTRHLDFAEADLTSDAAWDEIMQGADGLLHVASPLQLKDPKDETALIAPAVEGTTRVLRAAERTGVRRAVVTSSTLTLFTGRRSGRYGPDSWADVDARIGAYSRSKTLAEQACWRLADSMRMELVTVLPGFVTGPALGGASDGESARIVGDLIGGRFPGIPDFAVGMVDVRDVARLHVEALRTPDAAGKRLIGSLEDPVPMAHLAATLRNAGYTKVPTRRLPTPLVRIAGLFDAQVRSMLPFVGTRWHVDACGTRATVGWSAGPIESGLLELAGQLAEGAMNRTGVGA